MEDTSTDVGTKEVEVKMWKRKIKNQKKES